MIRSASRWLFPTRDVSFEIRTEVAFAVAALRARTERGGLRALFRTGIVGRVDEHGIRLRYRRTWSHNDFAPVFTGHFEMRDGHTYLTGRFAARLWTRVFFSAWIVFILLWWVAAFAATILFTEPGIPLPIVLIAPPLMIAFGIGLARLSGRFAESDAAIIEAELREAAGARAD